MNGVLWLNLYNRAQLVAVEAAQKRLNEAGKDEASAWFYWRPVVYGVISEETMRHGDFRIVAEANAALDRKNKEEREAEKAEIAKMRRK